MREIKFRGFGKDKKQWIYGSLLDERSVGIVAIQDEKCHVWEVDPESVGQFTGLYDANRREIYEGDILSNGRDTVAVSYSIEFAAFVGLYNGREDLVLNLDDCIDQPLDELKLKVIGNVYDNPDLLEVAHD